MIRNQFILDLGHELAVDNFAGGGGASTGIEMAIRRHVDLAINHDPLALGMHEMNHPQTEHLPEDVFAVDPLKATQGRRVALAWFSPDCKHFSKAKGGKPVDKKIRGLALVILNWAATVRPRVIIKENVEEIQTWGPLLPNGRPDPVHKGRTFRAFVDALGNGLAPDHPDMPDILAVCAGKVTREQLIRGFGYQVEGRELRACDYGAPTIRKRFFMIARCDGMPIVWPEPTHGAPESEGVRSGRLQRYRTFADIAQWELPCPSIFMSRREAKAFTRRTGIRIQRPLARASQRRLAVGVWRHVMAAEKPFLAVIDGGLSAPHITEHANASRISTGAADKPLGTICGGVKGGHFALASAFLYPRYGERPAQGTAPAQAPRSRPVTEPLSTVVNTQNGDTLALVSLAKLRGNPEDHPPGKPVTEPLDTISAGGQHHGVFAAFVAQNNGGAKGNQSYGHGADEPVSTIAGKGSNQSFVAVSIATYYGADQDTRPGEALPTVTTRDRFALTISELAIPPLTPELAEKARRVARFLRRHGIKFDGEFATVTVGGVELVIVDIGMRMLAPRELYRAQGFPEAYVIDRAIVVDLDGTRREVVLTKEAQIRMCGNSVCPPMAEALVRANVPELVLEEAA